MRRPLPLASIIVAAMLGLTGIVGWFALPVAGDPMTMLWVPPPTATKRPTATPRPTNTPAPWALTATAKAMPRTPTPRPQPTSTPTVPPAPSATATARNTATLTPVPTREAAGGIGRPPQRCATEFEVVGSASFLLSVWANLAMIHAVSPADYDLAMACTADGARTRVRRIVQGTQLYSDWSGTVWVRDGIGHLAASSLLHEMLHITTYGWNASGSRDCRPENNTLEHQASWLSLAAATTQDAGLRAALLWYADWYRAQKGVWNCPAA
jgi:hypothetical protein